MKRNARISTLTEKEVSIGENENVPDQLRTLGWAQRETTWELEEVWDELDALAKAVETLSKRIP